MPCFERWKKKKQINRKKGKIKQNGKKVTSLTSIKYHDEGSYSLRTKAC